MVMKKGFIGEILFLALIIVFVFLSGYYFVKGRVMSSAKAKTFNSPVSHLESDGLSKSLSLVEEQKNESADNSPDLTKVVNQTLEGAHGTYGIVIRNLKTGERFEQNAHTVFPPASMYKLWVMAVVFDQIEQGKMTMDTSMSADVMNLNRKFHIDKENAELREGGFTFTIEEALERMIVVSHNYAAYMLTDKIGLKSIAPFLKQRFT
jgi:beta-lactamase class A